MWPRPVSNDFMGLLSSRWQNFGLKVVALVLVLCVGFGFGWMLWQRFHHHKITDQELLREAVTKYGPHEQIFEQQAAQGYYDDAAATGRLFKSPDYVQWSIVELAKIRAENGDVQAAENSIKSLAGTDLQKKAAEVIARIQAQNGDLAGALNAIAPFGESDEVFLAYGRHQIEMGDFEGTLDTAERTKSGYQLFYEIGDALRIRGEQSRARKLAAHMKDRKLAALFLNCARFTLWLRPDDVRVIQATPCDDAYLDATQGKFAEADDILGKNRCGFIACSVAVLQYKVDPQGAERLLRKTSDSESMAFGLKQFAAVAAKKRNTADALRFLAELQRMGQKDLGIHSWVPLATQEIARAWTIREGPEAVLKWARSRPTPSEGTWALIGMAEALGHVRPGQAPTK